jgi:hypothetical protein
LDEVKLFRGTVSPVEIQLLYRGGGASPHEP